MNNFLTSAKLNRYELEKARHDLIFSSPETNYLKQEYVLITNYGPLFDVREMNNFGEIKQIEYDKNYKYYIVSYTNPENAKKAVRNYNYSEGNIKMQILSEEEKNGFLRKIQDDSNYIDRDSNYFTSKLNSQINSEMINKNRGYYIPNNDDLVFKQEPPKSDFQKFWEVFFNL